MSFDAYGTSAAANSNKPKVDYNAMNQYVVDTAGLEERETLIGVVAGIVDLGTQEQPDAEMTFTGTPEDEEKAIASNPNTYFKDGIDPQSRKPVRLKCWPQKPVQAVAIAIDFPDIQIDKGQFFGESNPQPLRLWLGGQFWNETKGMLIARPTYMKVVNLDKEAPAPKFSFSPLHLCYKMAVAAKLIKAGEQFLPNRIDELIGKSFQFEAQIFMKDYKGKNYYNEYIKFVGGLGRGQVSFEPENTFMLQFNKHNKPEDLKQLRNHVINTIKAANNYQGSSIQKQLEAGKEGHEDKQSEVKQESKPESKHEVKPESKPVAKPAQKVVPKVEEDFDDDSIPF